MFDQVSNHLLSQLEFSYSNTDAHCVYHHPDGRMCAAGCLISHDEYKPMMEGSGWLELVDEGVVPRHHCELIMSLQRIHDKEDVVDWNRSLRRLSEDRGLIYRDGQ